MLDVPTRYPFGGEGGGGLLQLATSWQRSVLRLAEQFAGPAGIARISRFRCEFGFMRLEHHAPVGIFVY